MTETTMQDDRPVIEPQFFSYRELPEDRDDCQALWREMVESMKADGAAFFRMTIVSPEHPMPPYPDGLYTEGWIEPHPRQAPFNYPLMAIE